jgi:hypothetical protein
MLLTPETYLGLSSRDFQISSKVIGSWPKVLTLSRQIVNKRAILFIQSNLRSRSPEYIKKATNLFDPWGLGMTPLFVPY